MLTTSGRGRVTLATQLLPTLGRCSSQQLGDHPRWPNQALAVLPKGNYTLGANLLPLPGEAWERAESTEKESVVLKLH